MDGKLLKELTIPLFTGAIGYLTNWTGVWMLFYPIRFAGWRVPGLKGLTPILPRRIQQIPGVMQGGVGWQGIIPSRAANPLRYQVLEAQPEVDAAMGTAGHTRAVRRSIHLTPFGRDFCELCLPAEVRQPDLGEDRDGPG